MAVTIKTVGPGSPAERAGLAAGMRLLSVNGHPIADGLDYEFYTTGANLAVEAEQDGRPLRLAVKKDEYQPLGCGFETYLASPQRACRNKCVFCFVDQLPRGLRPSLYFKDDDERLGFLFGNYITLTNLTGREVDRIVAMRFSPVNISVHTANPELRCRMMGNPDAGSALEIIPRLAQAGIEMNFQLVLCPGINDGAELERSIEWLAGFGEAVRSVAAVPVGLTRHRQGLAEIKPYTRKTARRQLKILLKAGRRLKKAAGRRVVYPSDEWFLLAGRAIPGEAFYDGYPQLENGVGMWRLMADEFAEALADSNAPRQTAAEADLVVGTLAEGLFKRLAAALRRRYPRARLYVHAVTNNFFGPAITVTGLLTGGDIIAQLGGRLHTGRLLLPADTLRAGGDLLLDGATPAGIGQALGVEVCVAGGGGRGLLEAVLGPGTDALAPGGTAGGEEKTEGNNA